MRVFQEEQIMYPSSLEGERFMVALVNCKRGHYESSDGITQETQAISWEITRALKWEWRLYLLMVQNDTAKLHRTRLWKSYWLIICFNIFQEKQKKKRQCALIEAALCSISA